MTTIVNPQNQDLWNNNVEKNRAHYDQLYSGLNCEDAITKIRSFDKFFPDAIQTDTSWHGLYQGNFASRLKDSRVLEFGCGDGLNALVMAHLGAHVTAHDISEQSERHLRNVAAELDCQNVQAVSGNFQELKLEDESLDFVVGKSFLHHLTHDLEEQYIVETARLLKSDGEARFFEPAVNSQWLDQLRWMLPVPGRPSALNKKAFDQWKASDPHPDRDNSSQHYLELGKKYFHETEVVPLASVERLCRWMPRSQITRGFRRFAHRLETYLPTAFRKLAARSQLIVFRYPIRDAAEGLAG